MKSQPPGSFASTRLLLQRLRDTQAYFLASLDAEIEQLERKVSVSELDLVRSRAFALAYAGHEDLAIRSFDVLVSQKDGRTPRALNKLAQLLVRRGAEQDLERAIKSSKAALELARDDDHIERWFAHHNLAGAYLQRREFDDAYNAAMRAQEYREDPRTEALLRLSEAASSRDVAVEVRAQLSERGMISLDLSPDADLSSRESLIVVLGAEPVGVVYRPPSHDRG